MPRLGLTQELGVVVEWRKGVGDSVRRGEVLAVIETDKATEEIEAEHDGVVAEILVAEGVDVPVLTVIARLRIVGPPG